MPSITQSVAAATAVVGYDLLSGVPDAQSGSRNRIVTSAGINGSAAANDTSVEIWIGGTRVGTLYNRTTGGLSSMDDMVPLGNYMPIGSRLSARVVDAPTTNPINVRVNYVDL